MAEPLHQGWKSSLAGLFCAASEELTIASPFISQNGAQFLIDALPSEFRNQGVLHFVTDLSPRNIGQGATDPLSFQMLFDSVSSVQLYHLPRLHAKVYLRDSHEAIVTSGNLTDGGVFRNFEYGLRIVDEECVKSIRRDLLSYADLGASIDQQCVSELCDATSELRSVYAERQRRGNVEIEQRIKKLLEETKDKIIGRHFLGGSLHSILKRTIIYLLGKHGSLSTVELHRLVREIHPDLCDDTVDRVINGVRFGKKWKHAIRSAQSALKQRGIANLSEGKWSMLESPSPEPTYWFKPIGSVSEPVSSDRDFSGNDRMHFSKTRPAGVKPNDILLAYAVGSKLLLSAYRVDSAPLKMTDYEVKKLPRFERWPWYVETENLTQEYGARWFERKQTYDELIREYLIQFPSNYLTPTGKKNLDALYWGKDKVKLTPHFAKFLISRLNGKN